jgi:hypothetical protein
VHSRRKWSCKRNPRFGTSITGNFRPKENPLKEVELIKENEPRGRNEKKKKCLRLLFRI